MNSAKLIEQYGRRFTPLSKMVGFILVLAVGVVAAFCESDEKRMPREVPGVEQHNE